ncbi:unnamed protein product [Nezara viridula]|uniref:Peroxiredoxin-5 n=1 Tax=Nezara viridula TaxID=85310 RepID=A0A9P0HV44_NEZVI|nr:unnamed protein product [Nezara viridula]
MHWLFRRPLFRLKPVLSKSFTNTSILNMPIQVGDTIPDATLYENTPGNKVNIKELCAGKKVVIFAVPGAFTPGCSKTHLPGYVKDSESIKSSGIAEIVCVSVNDPFVMGAWAKDHNAEGKVRMLADPSAEFTKALELDTNLPPLGGVRSKRYSMVIDDGVVTKLNVEPDGTGLSCSLSKNLKF